MKLVAHPYADIFPLLEGTEFIEFVDDIRAHGLRDPIVLLDQQIVDGRNRYNALVFLAESGEVLGDGWGHRAGEPLDPELLAPSSDNVLFRNYNPAEDSSGDLLGWVWSKNYHRRQLSKSQLAMALSDRERFRHGGDRRSTDQEAQVPLDRVRAETRAELAEKGVSERYLTKAAVIRDHGTDELRTAVRQGHLTVSSVSEVAALPPERQAEIVSLLPRDETGRLTAEARKALAPVIKEVRAEKQAEKRERRDQREANLGRKLQAMPDKKYGVAIEDFEWDHEPWSRDSGMDRHPSNHYPTASDAHTPEEIVARTAERFKCLADDCVLYMWTTIPHEAIAHRVLELRGFKYVSQRAWFKRRPGAGRGPGYWVTGEHELLLIAVRGKVVPPVTAHFPSAFSTPVGAHSEKPDQQYEHAEFHFPSLPKIELNARRAREGWGAWGFEAPESQAKADAENAATEGASAPAAEGMDSAASRLAGGRTPDTAEGDAVAASSSADAFFGEDERAIWKALSALDAGITIEGPILEALVHDGLIMTGAVDCGYLLTTRGLSTLGMYDAHFNPPVDCLSTDELQALNEIPREGASGTAREAPSAGSGDGDLQSASGIQSAPPHVSTDTDAPGCTAASAGGAGPLSTVPPEPDPLDIPAFLKRQPDNLMPARESEEADHAAA